MSKRISLRVRDIVRFAKHRGEGIYPGTFQHCATATVGKMVGVKYDWRKGYTDFTTKVARKTGRTEQDIKALEAGFELRDYAWGDPSNTAVVKNRYYKVGRRLRDTVGG